MKVCDKTCIFFFFPIINKYFLMAKRSLLSRCPSYKSLWDKELVHSTEPRARLADLSEGEWPNCLQISKKSFRMPMGILKNKIRSWKLPQMGQEQLVEALRYKPEGRGFDSRLCYWNFSLTQSFRPHCGPGVDSASNRNEHQEYFLGGKGGRCVELTILPPSMCRLS